MYQPFAQSFRHDIDLLNYTKVSLHKRHTCDAWNIQNLRWRLLNEIRTRWKMCSSKDWIQDWNDLNWSHAEHVLRENYNKWHVMHSVCNASVDKRFHRWVTRLLCNTFVIAAIVAILQHCILPRTQKKHTTTLNRMRPCKYPKTQAKRCRRKTMVWNECCPSLKRWLFSKPQMSCCFKCMSHTQSQSRMPWQIRLITGRWSGYSYNAWLTRLWWGAPSPVSAIVTTHDPPLQTLPLCVEFPSMMPPNSAAHKTTWNWSHKWFRWFCRT